MTTGGDANQDDLAAAWGAGMGLDESEIQDESENENENKGGEQDALARGKEVGQQRGRRQNGCHRSGLVLSF